MKKRQKPIDEFNYEVSYFCAMLDGKGDETADDSYKKIIAEGLLLILFTLERISTGVFLLLGILLAMAFRG